MHPSPSGQVGTHSPEEGNASDVASSRSPPGVGIESARAGVWAGLAHHAWRCSTCASDQCGSPDDSMIGCRTLPVQGMGDRANGNRFRMGTAIGSGRMARRQVTTRMARTADDSIEKKVLYMAMTRWRMQGGCTTDGTEKTARQDVVAA